MHCNYREITAASTRVQLMHSFAFSHMTFACAVWGHAFGTKLQLHATAAGGCTRLSTLLTSALRWAIRAPSLMHPSVLFVIYNMLPLHGIIVKQIVQYFHGLEHSLKHARPASAMVPGTYTQCQLLLTPHWAVKFLEASVSQSTPRAVSTHCIEGLLQLRCSHQLQGDDCSVSWIYAHYQQLLAADLLVLR